MDSRYYVVFKDDFTSFRATYLMHRKNNQVSEKLGFFLEVTKMQAQVTITELRTNNGMEFDNNKVCQMTQKIGLKHSFTVPYTPQQNGVAKRDNRILVEMARSWLEAKNLPKFLWCEAVITAAYTLNRTAPTKVKGKAPIKLFFKKESKIDHLKIFGTKCFVWIPGQKRKKLDGKSMEGIMVGYSDCGYRIYVPKTRAVHICLDVKFEDEKLLLAVQTTPEVKDEAVELSNDDKDEQGIPESNEEVNEADDDETDEGACAGTPIHPEKCCT